MKKFIALVAAACLCAVAAMAVVGCSAPAQSSSSSSASLVASDVSASKQVSTKTDPVYILAVGNDSRYKTSEENGTKETDPSYSDTMMLLRVDPSLNSIAICSIPRDTIIMYHDQESKINDVHLTGNTADLCKEVGKLFGVEVPYYFDLSFVQFNDFVNKLGGVTAVVPKDMTGGDVIEGKDITLSAGEQKLNGEQALMLVRQRKLYDGDGEAIRQVITRDLVSRAIQAVADQPSTEAAKYTEIMEKAGKTNMPAEDLQAYITAFMSQSSPIAFSLGTAPYETVEDANGRWGINYEPEKYAALKQAMETGGDLNAIVAPPALA